MSDILVRGLNSVTVDRLKARAKRNGRSLQREAKLILEQAATPTIAEALASADRIRRGIGKRFSDSSRLIRQDRDR